jgi:hypothetical protein
MLTIEIALYVSMHIRTSVLVGHDYMGRDDGPFAAALEQTNKVPHLCQ